MPDDPGDAALSDRLVELELRFMQQAEQLEALNGVVISQGALIDALFAEVASLRKRLFAEPGLVDPKDDGPPPHY